jgi:predicted NAD-dependent protein-ADP-ribosyltransferase YbiA (DUF1768 family)
VHWLTGLGVPIAVLPPPAVVAVAEKRLKMAKNKGNIGLFAKLAANPKNAQAFRLAQGDMDYRREHLPPEMERHCWLAILRLKFKNNAELKRLLVEGTGDKMIVEHAREGGQRAVMAGDKAPPHWGALLKDGRLIGDNAMGRYLMEIRDVFDA